jgi:Xaa-Pro aminopeptidase
MEPNTRLFRLQQLLQGQPLEALLIEQPLSLGYLTGLHLSAGQLLLTSREALLLVDGRYTEAASRQHHVAVGALHVDQLRQWCQDQGVKRLGFIADHTSVARWQQLERQLEPHAIALQPIADLVMQLRLIKDDQEISALRKAAQLTVAGIRFAESLLEEGVREDQVALEMEIFWRRAGGQRLAFDPIIAFGPNSSMPHYRAGFTQLGQHDAVLIDAGVVIDGYHGDCTRFFPRHQCPPQLQLACNAVAEAQQKAIQAVRPGVALGELDAIARRSLRGHQLEPYFTHSLGHGIGLEIHEPPRLKEDGPDREILCQAGMVFTIEPGVYLPGIGGVRLEETVLVTDSGCEILTAG